MGHSRNIGCLQKLAFFGESNFYLRGLVNLMKCHVHTLLFLFVLVSASERARYHRLNPRLFV
jgi:hypothetical protein